MPSIYLKQTGDSYDTGAVKVNVQKEQYSPSNLFTRYKHSPSNQNNWKPKNQIRISFIRGMTLLRLNQDEEYANKELSHAYVYFNQFDKTHSKPLLLSLHFNNEKPQTKGVYLQYSEIESRMGRRPIDVSDMSEFEKDKELFDFLILENFSRHNSLTYYVNKIGEQSRKINYHSGAISISQKENVDNGQPNGFYKYKHTPKYGAMNSYILYNKHVLARNDKSDIKEIQGQVYSSITVYFGTRAKIPGSRNKDIPLLIELTKKHLPNEPDYYVHKRNSSGYYWEQLPGDSRTNTLKDLLVDMGFGMNKGENGYNELHRILSTAGVNGLGGDEDLSDKFGEVTGSKLQTMLGEKVGGDSGSGSQKTLLQLLLTQIEFDLLDSVVILLDKKDSDGQYGESEVSKVVSSLVPPKEINTIDMGGQNITVSNETNGKAECVKDYGYKLISHNITQVVQEVGSNGQPAAGIRFIIPSESNKGFYNQLKLYDKDKPNPQNLQYTYYQKNGQSTSNSDKVYVWFYDGSNGKGTGDPRPLMVCYNNHTYAPKNKESYFTEWSKVDVTTGSGSTNECGCSIQGSQVQETDNKLLQELDKVVKFLNKVQLKEGTTSSGTSHKYEVQTFKGQKIQINVECSTVGVSSSEPPPSPGTCSLSPRTSCYKKFKHTAAGMNGTGGGLGNNGSGFRLGEIEYNGTTGGIPKGTLDYITQSNHKYHPLVSVTVYYYDKDKDYDDPLLIELEFKTNGGANGGATEKEYYRLQAAGNGLGGDGTLKWDIDKAAPSAINGAPGGDNTQKIVEHLDGIRHSLKPVVKILIDKQVGYGLCWSSKPGGTGDTYSQHNGGTNKIDVQQCGDSGCSKLSDRGYKCYVHNISKLNGTGSGFDYNSIGGLKFYISGTNSVGASVDNDIEIPLQNDDGPLKEITYNTCMGDVYVFFYCKNGADESCTRPAPESTPPTAPLMLLYNKNYYKPENIDNYFQKWVPETGLASVTAPCGGNINYTTLVTSLDKVNRSLNRINLGPSTVSGLSGGGTTSAPYGISKPEAPASTTPNIELNRITVTKIPGKPPATRPYCKLVHRTMNSFDIGDIYYDKQNITSGVQINGSGTIKVDSPGHTKFVTGSNRPNTVVAYYHKDDGTYKLPQLIVLLHTDKAIEHGASETITASRDTKYGYYVLATSGGGYKYEWLTPTENSLTLDYETEFKLLNSIIILIEKQTTYQERVINSAVSSAKIQSPGNESGVNRLQNKQITVQNTSTDKGKCVSTYGYKLFEHSLSTITAEIFQIKPILGLRFLIPGKKNENQYKQVTLYKQDTTTPENIEYMYCDGINKTLYVYFYGDDPRPLLLCYEKSAYIPKKKGEPTPGKQVDVDYTKWTKVPVISKCVCENGETESSTNEILDTLLKVVLFLNPVQLNPKHIPTSASGIITKSVTNTTYNLHEYKHSSHVKMKITRTDVACYDKYTYEPNGTSSSGEGFRLGNVLHTNTNRSSLHSHLKYSDLRTSFPYDPVVGVTVYYYDHDTKYEEPLLIELGFKINTGKSLTPDYKEYYKLSQVGDGTTSVDWKLDPDAQTQIGKGDTQKIVTYLDTIRYQFKKVLQVCIAIKQNKTYQANLINRDNGPVVKSNEQISVTVSEEFGCQSIQNTGFRCFKHGISTLQSDKLHKFAALKFLIPSQEASEVKLNLHDSTSSRAIDPLYYNCGMGDIYVYFYGGDGQGDGDPRPLLLCYNKTAYRAPNILYYDLQEWHKGSHITECPCDKDNGKNLLIALVHVSNYLNRVQIGRVSEGLYTVHKFNGMDIIINLKITKGENKFCYHKYTHTHKGMRKSTENGENPKSTEGPDDGQPAQGFRLGRIDYGNSCIKEISKPSRCIDSIISQTPKFEPASEVVVYYYKGDPNHQNPLLVVLCSNSRGSGTSCSCKPYYELQRDSTNEPKKYTKHLIDLSLDTTKGGQLEKLLDKLLSKGNKILQINLSFRVTTENRYPGPTKTQKITIIKNAYTARVYKNESPPKLKKTSEKIEIQVSGPTDVLTDKKQETGYQCYQHKLTSVKNINNFGGLRLFLWDNRGSDDDDKDPDECKITPPTTLDTKHECCELDLYGDGTQTNGTCDKKIEPISYTTCKGDLYVYFYGSDPRPMLLCYNGDAYGPPSLDEYNQKWCRVKVDMITENVKTTGMQLEVC